MDDHVIGMTANVLDALACAKEAHALLPQLPPSFKPAHFRILIALHRIRDDAGSARVSDISKASGLLLPNATKFINELVEQGFVEKHTPASDKRVVLVRATELGERYIQEHVVSFYKRLEKELSTFSESSCVTMYKTIFDVYQALQRVCRDDQTDRDGTTHG